MTLCTGCNKEIVGRYIEALGRSWHPEHFVCTTCGKAFAQESYFQHEGKPYCEEDYYAQFGTRCAECGKPIKGEYVQSLGRAWHPGHFVCAVCKQPFKDNKFIENDGQPYCEDDYYDKFGQRCSVCREPIKKEYFTDAWQNQFCARHKDELSPCFSCSRLICDNLTGGGVQYEDGRKICNLCRKTAVDELDQAAPLFAEMRRALAAMGANTDGDFPLRLADLDEIDRLAGGTPQIEAGITLMEVITSDGRETARHVQEVLILRGLPRAHSVVVMAHEFGHVWCFLNRVPDMPLMLQEGLCELFAYLLLSQTDSPEYRYHMQNIAENTDPVYGAGFRKMRENLGNKKLSALLDDLRRGRTVRI